MKNMEERINRLGGKSSSGAKPRSTKNTRKGSSAPASESIFLDPGSFDEFNMLVKYQIGAPGDGIVIGHGTIDGRRVCVGSNDATVLGGSEGYMHGRKLYKIHEMALEMGVPIIMLKNSPGARVVKRRSPAAMTLTA